MNFFNSTGFSIKDVIPAVIDSITETMAITKDCIVELLAVTTIKHEGKAPSIQLKWKNDKGETIIDFRNFSGKTKEALAKQIVYHIQLLSKLGFKYETYKLQSFTSMDDMVADMAERFRLLQGRTLGIEVAYNDKSSYYDITKYCTVNDFVASEEDAYEDDVPF